MLYSEYEELRKNFESIFKNIHCELTHNNTFVIHECNKLINRLNDDVWFPYESMKEEFEMGGYRERDEMVARLEKLRDIARNNRDSQLDPEDILPDIDTTINTINYEKVNIGDDTLQDVDTTINGFNHDGVSVDGTDTLKDIDTTINGFNNDVSKIDVNTELNTIDSLGVDLFNNNSNSLEIYTKTDLNGKTFLPLRYNESFNVFFGVNGYKKCNMDKNQLGYFNESCDTLSTVTYNEQDGSVDVCDTLFNILEYCKNNKNTAEAIDNILNVKVNILSSLKYLCSIDDSYNKYSKFYYDFARMCDDLVSKIKASEESNKHDGVFEQLSNEGVLLPIVKVGDSKELRAFIGPSKNVLVGDSVDILDCKVFNINALLGRIRMYNNMYDAYYYIHSDIYNICSGKLGESHISKLNELIRIISESYDRVKQYSSDIETYKYVYDYYIDYINDIINNIKNSKRDEEIRTALNDIGNVKVDDTIVVPNNKDFSLSNTTDFSKSWYDGTDDMDFFLKYFKFEDKRMLGPNGTYYTLVSDLLIEEEHYDALNTISHSTFSKGTAIAPDGTMLKYTNGELVYLTQKEWISELGCEGIDNSKINKKSSLYNMIIADQDNTRLSNWKGCFPLNNSKDELSKVPLLARCFFIEDNSNKRPVFYNGFTPSLDDSDRGLQDTSYYLKASSEKGDIYKFLYTNRIILNGKGSAVKEQDDAIDRENKKAAMRQITSEKLNSITKGKVQNIDGVKDLTGSVLKGIGSMSGKAGNTISKFFKQSKK